MPWGEAPRVQSAGNRTPCAVSMGPGKVRAAQACLGARFAPLAAVATFLSIEHNSREEPIWLPWTSPRMACAQLRAYAAREEVSAGKGRRSFTAEFKAEAVRRGIEGGKSLAEVARELDLGESLLRCWKQVLATKRDQAFHPSRRNCVSCGPRTWWTRSSSRGRPTGRGRPSSTTCGSTMRTTPRERRRGRASSNTSRCSTTESEGILTWGISPPASSSGPDHRSLRARHSWGSPLAG